MRVQLPFTQKVALGSVFSLGIVVMIFAVIRVIVTNRARTHPDVSWLNLWSQIEASVAVVISSVAPFKTFFTQRRTKSYHYGSSPKGQQYAPPASWGVGHKRGSSGPPPPIQLEGRSYQHATRHSSVTKMVSSKDRDSQERMLDERAVGFKAMM